jgi:hypothetical protein
MPLAHIEVETRKMGKAIKRETLAKHFRVCLDGQTPFVDDAGLRSISEGASAAQSDAERDFAILVQRRATEMLRDGQLRVTASHGLQAQALLDRRAEKQADRDLALNMARLLSGAITMTPYEIIEGRNVTEVREITDGLAPISIVER